ncbi:response regulator [Pseudoalteromonas sp. SMS1]|uniref:hybrid sensor histidine kinase/response regulator transcription factor n=1 Tax=Pseudoalteromonas sp. SMS1 TaxID=2908894 RepID=UPI001F263E8D|nr:response regulator [Pseudoalteromonas sp. SMS1]MCF2857012.1 response regulator [Pseudoalteromonas sp. SMS1]
MRCSLVLCLFLGIGAEARSSANNLLSVGDGLPSNRVFDITRDHRGFMWFATEHGIARFDGTQVRRFSVHQTPKLSTSLWVRALLFDSQHRLWAGGKQGLEVLNKNVEAFEQVAVENAPQALNVYSLFESGQGTVWVGAKSGLYKVTGTQLEFVPFEFTDITNPERPQVFKQRILSITAVDQSMLLVASDVGVMLLNTDTLRAESIYSKEGEPLHADKVWQLNDGRIWLSMQGVGLAEYLPGNRQVEVRYLDENQFDTVGYVFDLVKHEERLLAASLNAGLLHLGTKATLIDDFPPLLSIFTDSQVRAFGSYTEGAVIEHANLQAVKNLAFSHPSETHQFEINDMVFLNDHIWVADQLAGLCRYQINGRLNGCLATQDLSAQAIAKGSNNTLWVSFYQELLQIDAQSLQILNQFSFAEHGIPDSIYAIVVESDTAIWLSHSFDGLTKFNPQTGQTQRYTQAQTELLSDQVHSIVKDNNVIWIATSAGVQMLDVKTGWVSTHDVLKAEFKHTVYDLFLSPEGVLFLQTDSGIKAFNTHENTWLTLPKQLAHITDVSIAFTPSGHVWFASGLGIFSWHPDKADEVRYFDKGDGLYHQGYLGSAATSTGHELVFASAEGLTLFAPEKLTYFDARPKVSEFEMTFGDGSTRTFLNQQSLFELPYQHASIRFNIANTNFASASKQQFRYKLEGVSQAWVELGNSRVLMIPRLSYGEYNLKIQSTDSMGNWSNTTGEFEFSIKTPWFATIWAYFAYGLASVMCLFAIYHLRVAALKRIQRKLEQEVARQTKAITEQNLQLSEQSQALASAEAQRTLLLKTLSHELMTPVSLIQGPAEQLLKAEQAQERTKMANIVVSNAKRLKVLIEQLMQVSEHHGKPNQAEKHAQPVLQAYDLSKICHEQANAFAPLLTKQGSPIELNIAPNVMVYAGQDQLEQCVSNLLSNAIKYSAQGSPISLDLKTEQYQEGTRCTLSVQDKGIGISSDELTRIFEPEYRTEQGSQYSVGLGIGLSVVKSTVEALNGSVDVHSIAGQGSTFTLTFKEANQQGQCPIEATHQMPDTVQNADNSLIGPQLARSILIVDDTPDMLEFLHSVFGKSYKVMVARDGEEALSLAQSVLPDLIISDVMMPKLDGFGLLSAIKQDTLTAHIPVILLTANLNEQRQIEGLTLRADDYITKPFNLQALELKVSNLFNHQQAMLDKWRKRLTETPRKDALSLPALPKLQFKDEPHIYDFLDKLDAVAERYYRQPDTTVAELAKEMALSERQLHRKLTALISMGANEYLRTYRLYKSVTPLLNGKNVAQVADEVGFNSGSYFSACFKKQFGMTAKTFVQKQRDKHSELKK